MSGNVTVHHAQKSSAAAPVNKSHISCHWELWLPNSAQLNLVEAGCQIMIWMTAMLDIFYQCH